MNSRPFVISICVSLLLLVGINGILVTAALTTAGRAESCHDELMTLQGEFAALKDAYTKLLEKVGGADPFTPATPKRPQGKLGDK